MTGKNNNMKTVPMRRCIGCMTSFPQKEIVRIAYAEGKLKIDTSGRMTGRGAYLCRSLDCFDMAAKKRRFGYALKVSPTPEDITELRAEYAKEITDAEVNE